MNQKIDNPYADDQLNGLAIADQIVSEWHTGRHRTIAEVTSAVHRMQSELPRSVIFWLAYHTLGQTQPRQAASRSWPLR